MAKRKFKKRPNHSGTVAKLSGNRRKPYVAKITDGYHPETGAQIQKPIGYFENEQEALDALTLYNLIQKKQINDKDASTLSPSTYDTLMIERNKNMPTFEEIYLILDEKEFCKLSNSTQRGYKSWFKKFKVIHDRKINTINLHDLQAVFDSLKQTKGTGTLNHMKVLVVRIFNYAVIHQHINRDQDFTSYIDASSNMMETSKHKIFSVDEIRKLIADGTRESKIVLTFVFTGMRPNELLKMTKDHIYFDVPSNDDGKESIVSYMVGGSKTEAGKGRIIPIHDVIKPYIKELIEEDNLYLLTDKRSVCAYYEFKDTLFQPLMERLEMSHLPYDTRHTFSTLAKTFRLDTFARKRIMGHKANDLTDDVYTHTVINFLYEEIHKIQL